MAEKPSGDAPAALDKTEVPSMGSSQHLVFNSVVPGCLVRALRAWQAAIIKFESSRH